MFRTVNFLVSSLVLFMSAVVSAGPGCFDSSSPICTQDPRACCDYVIEDVLPGVTGGCREECGAMYHLCEEISHHMTRVFWEDQGYLGHSPLVVTDATLVCRLVRTSEKQNIFS